MIRIHDVFLTNRQGTDSFIVLLETDVREHRSFLRFLEITIDFAEEYFRKVRYARREREPDPEGDALQAAARVDRARILEMYRSIPGRRKDRLRGLLARLKAEGRTETLGSVQMLLALANEAERRGSADRLSATLPGKQPSLSPDSPLRCTGRPPGERETGERSGRTIARRAEFGAPGDLLHPLA